MSVGIVKIGKSWVTALACALLLCLPGLSHAAEKSAAAPAKFFPLDGGPTKSGKIYRMPKNTNMKFAPYPLGQRNDIRKYTPARKAEAQQGVQIASSAETNDVILSLFDQDPEALLD